MTVEKYDRRCIIVAGMHRSGTSALTRVINLLGADLPDELMEGNDYNKLGHWEPKELYKNHDKALASAGLKWDDFFFVDEQWFKSDPAKQLQLEITEFLEFNFSRSKLFVIKDPRICRLIPIWIRALHDFSTEPLFVIPIRNPLEVAHSLKKRDNIPIQKSLLLWLRNVLDVEFRSRTFKRSFLSYDNLLRDWLGATNSIAKDLGVSWPCKSRNTEAEVFDFLSIGYRNNYIPEEYLVNRRDIVSWVKDTYKAMQNFSNLNGEIVHFFDQIRSDLDKADLAYAPIVCNLSKELKTETKGKELLVRERDAMIIESKAATQERDLALHERNAALHEVLGLRRKNEESVIKIAELVERNGKRQIENEGLSSLCLTQKDLIEHLKLEIKEKDKAFYTEYLKVKGLESTKSLWESKVFEYVLLPIKKIKQKRKLKEEIRIIEKNEVHDARWYLEQYPDVKDSGMKPVVHFLIHGAKELRNPGPNFDTFFYIKNYPDVANTNINPLIHYIKHGKSEGRKASENEILNDSKKESLSSKTNGERPGIVEPDFLISTQKKLVEKTQLKLVKDKRKGSTRFAVFMPCGAGSVHEKWIKNTNRSFDLIVYCYDDTFVESIQADAIYRKNGEFSGTKFSSFARLISDCPDIVENYDFWMLLDDDILTTHNDIDNLFKLMVAHGLDLAQPSLSVDSPCAWPVLRHKQRSFFRNVNAVEIMAFMFSKRALKLGAHLFYQSISGYGIDFALSRIVCDQLKSLPTVIDSITIKHTKEIDQNKGKFYVLLRENSLDPMEELKHLQRLYQFEIDIHELN